MNRLQHVSDQAQAVESWLNDHDSDLQKMAGNLSAGPVPGHFDAEDLHTVMTLKIWVNSICDPRFFLAGDLALLKAAWLEALSAIVAGPRYALNIKIL